MRIAISTESVCDLGQELINKYNIHTLPYCVILGNEVVPDNDKVPARIFEYVKETKKLPKTSAINETTYKDYFVNLLKDYDAVIHITLSSGLTSSVSHCKTAASKLKNVYVVDSLSLSSGIGLLAIYGAELAKTCDNPQEIVDNLTARIPFVQASFVVDKLDYLYKGGRCNALALFGANILKIHPQIVVTDGIMKPSKRYRGKMEKVIEAYCQDTLEEYNNADKTRAFVTYTTATEHMIEIAVNALKNAGFKEIYTTVAGGTITSHCGEHVLGILYINDAQ